MSMIKCKELGKEVSDKKFQCRDCGATIMILILTLIMMLLSACGESFENILTTEKWKVFSSGDEVTYEFNKDGTGQYSYKEHNPNEFKWEINDNELSLIYGDSGTDNYIISKDGAIYQLKRNEEKPLYSGKYVLTRQKDFEELYDFEDRLTSKAEFDVFLIYNSNFSNGNYVEVFVTSIENFNDVYTVSGKAKYTDENYKSYTGTFEIQYKYDGDEIIEIDNYFSRPN